MSDIVWKHLDGVGYSSFQRELLRERGGVTQVDFLNSLQDRVSFLEGMRRKGVVEEGDEDIALYPDKFTEGSFIDPPEDTERKIYQYWKQLTPDIASRSSFWAYVTMFHIKNDMICPSFLARNGKYHSGKERIERVLSSSDKSSSDKEKRDEKIDECVRTVIRQLSGLPARGNRSVFVDCPLARAWWRGRIIARAEQRPEIEDHFSPSVIRQSKSHWEAVVTTMVSRNPVLGMGVAQDALIHGLENLKSKKFNSQDIKDICQKFCIIVATREIGIFEFNEISEEISDLLSIPKSSY